MPTMTVRAMADLATPMSIRVGATLRVADHIAAGATTTASIADRCEANPDALERLLLHWSWAGLLTRAPDGSFALTELGNQLTSDHPSRRREWLDMTGSVGRGDLAFVELLHTIVTGGSAYHVRYGQGFWDDLDNTPRLRESFDALMNDHVETDNAGIVHAYPWDRHDTVVDVAGGNGALLTKILTAHPAVRGHLVELERPAAQAHDVFTAAGIQDRVSVSVGSFFDTLPIGDAYIYSAILHDWDDEACARILKTAQARMPAGARLLVIEAVGKDGESVDPRMDLRMLAYTGGKERGIADLERLATNAGFELRGTHRVPGKDYMAVLEFSKADQIQEQQPQAWCCHPWATQENPAPDNRN